MCYLGVSCISHNQLNVYCIINVHCKNKKLTVVSSLSKVPFEMILFCIRL